MRRGLVAAVILLAAVFAAEPALAASWAKPQIKVVVANGLMGPSVSNFRAKQNVTREELYTAIAAFTGKSQVVVDPDADVSIAGLDAAIVKALSLRPAAKTFQRKVTDAGLQPPRRLGNEVVARLLWLRYDHPQSADNLELRPQDPATRAEATEIIRGLPATPDQIVTIMRRTGGRWAPKTRGEAERWFNNNPRSRGAEMEERVAA